MSRPNSDITCIGHGLTELRKARAGKVSRSPLLPAMSVADVAVLVAAALNIIEDDSQMMEYYRDVRGNPYPRLHTDYSRLARLGRISLEAFLEVSIFRVLLPHNLAIPSVTKVLLSEIYASLQGRSTTYSLPPDILCAFIGGLSEEPDPTGADRWMESILAKTLAAVKEAAAGLEISIVDDDESDMANAARRQAMVQLAEKIGRDTALP
ncbi:hypothetical protein FB451DRAFT_1571429 [Mycena latifolia]|nr:hypothetical protein FB451DRAFT_1571429 [Mycena latifolia]